MTIQKMYNPLTNFVRRIKEFMTNRLTTWGAIGLPIGVTLLILGMDFFSGLWLAIMIFVGILTFGIGFYCVYEGIRQGREYDKKAEAERIRIGLLMDNLPSAINTAVGNAVREGIIQSGLQSSIEQLNQLIRDLPIEISKAIKQTNQEIPPKQSDTDTTQKK